MRSRKPPTSRSRSTASRSPAAGGGPGRPRRPGPVTPLDLAARLLARAPRTEAELTARLVALGYRPATAAATVARCRELGWVGDATYACDRARALRLRGAGSLRIAADLDARGLPPPLVERAVAESLDGTPEREWARLALERMQARTPTKRPRAWRLLASRGFPEDVIVDLLDEF